MNSIARFLPEPAAVRPMTSPEGVPGLSRADFLAAAGLDPDDPLLRRIATERAGSDLPVDPDVIDEAEAREALLLGTGLAADRARDAYLREVVIALAVPIEAGGGRYEGPGWADAEMNRAVLMLEHIDRINAQKGDDAAQVAGLRLKYDQISSIAVEAAAGIGEPLDDEDEAISLRCATNIADLEATNVMLQAESRGVVAWCRGRIRRVFRVVRPSWGPLAD